MRCIPFVLVVCLASAPLRAQERTRQVLEVRGERTSVTVSQYIEAGRGYVEIEGFQDPWIGFHRWTPPAARGWVGVVDSLARQSGKPARGETITYRAESPDGPPVTREVTSHGSVWDLSFEDRDGVIIVATLTDAQMRRVKAAVQKTADSAPQ